MKRNLVVAVLCFSIYTGLSMAHEDVGDTNEMETQMHKSHFSQKGMGMHGGMGMMQIMMMDPEIKKIMMKHMRECKKQVMKKMMGDQMVLKRMIRMLVMNKDTEKEILKENPDLKEEIKSMLK
ncbi:MAG TPA: hypothetical protein DEP48_09270 [Persephonella sp.]|nr:MULTISPECIES: hypothetical protein [Persephonella]HCB70535.1 hypothetical protein [Persephonella sp.]